MRLRESHPPLYGLGGTYLEGDADKLRDRQNQAIAAAAERVEHFISNPPAPSHLSRARVIAIAAVDSYLRVMRESE